MLSIPRGSRKFISIVSKLQKRKEITNELGDLIRNQIITFENNRMSSFPFSQDWGEGKCAKLTFNDFFYSQQKVFAKHRVKHNLMLKIKLYLSILSFSRNLPYAYKKMSVYIYRLIRRGRKNSKGKQKTSLVI